MLISVRLLRLRRDVTLFKRETPRKKGGVRVEGSEVRADRDQTELMRFDQRLVDSNTTRVCG